MLWPTYLKYAEIMKFWTFSTQKTSILQDLHGKLQYLRQNIEVLGPSTHGKTRKTQFSCKSTRNTAFYTVKLQNIEVLGPSTHEQISEKLSFSLFLPERLQFWSILHGETSVFEAKYWSFRTFYTRKNKKNSVFRANLQEIQHSTQ